jgi:hypothetical protein
MSNLNEYPGLNPTDVLKRYKNIKVTVEGGATVSVAINAYRNNDAKAHPTVSGGGTQDALAVKDALLAVKSGAILKRCGGPQAYMDVFTGKGSPAAISAVMTCFVDYGGTFAKLHQKGSAPARKCAGWLADPALGWQETLQKISDEFLGLDCNGFVGNWLAACEPSFKLGAQHGPQQFFQKKQQTRSAVDEIQYWDVVVWANFSHVAVIDDRTSTPGRFNICQSAGGGPRVNEYAIVPASKDRFRLQGGIPSKDVAGEVYVVSHWA